MSKIDQGPGASSFESPSKVGWLYKHGGSGVSSHWRKRWFVADHHYLFYYKGPNDKKPVGIVCLPDYESCHKAEVKVWKKQHSFMLDRGNTGQENDSSEGAPVKNYVLYADSEEEMLDWIKALTEEIKPMIGEDRYANGFSGGGGGKTSSAGSGSSNSISSSSSGGSSKGKGKKGKGGGEPGVDDKALDKVTALAGEGPKLTHLTASRPKVPRGRRPPKRYAVFHEDDSRPEESPPATPDLSKPSEPSPSPSDSPATQKKKGHKPMVALLPSRAASVKVTPKTPPIPPAKVAKADSDVNITAEPESPRETTQKLKFARPTPPKKPVKEKPTLMTATIKEEVPTEAVPSPEPPSEVPVPHTPTTPTPPPTSQRPPTPPTKPSKEKEPTTVTTPFEKKIENVQQQQSREDDQQAKGAPRPSPVRRQRPQPPVKPRTNTMASTGSAAAMSGGSVEGGGTTVAAAPPTAAQKSESAVSQPPQQQQRPVPAKRPVPRKRVVTPQQSPSREAAPPSTVAAATAVTKETAALPKELDQIKKEPPVPAKEMNPQAAKEMVVSEKEGKAEPEREVETIAKTEELPPPKEPEILKKEGESAAVKETVLPEKEAKPETPVMAAEKEEKLLVEGKVEQPVAGVAVEKPQEKEEKLPPTPFDDIEEIVSELEKINIVQEGQKQLAEGEAGKKDTDNVEQKDDSKYVYEDMEPGAGEKGDNSARDEKTTTDSEYEIMNFDEEEKVIEKESAIVTGGSDGTTEEVARQQQQQQRQAPGKVHQYDQVALDEAEPRFKIHQYDQVALDEAEPKFKISSSSSKDFDGTLSSSSGYEHMNPAPAVVRADDKEREPSVDGEYVPMKDGVIIDQEPEGEQEVGAGGGVATTQTSTDKYEYEEPCEWVEKTPPIIRDVSPPYDTLTTTRLTPSPGHSRSDELPPNADVRRSVASSMGSVSSQKSLQTSSLEVKGGEGVGEERRRGSSGASRKSSEAGSSQLQPERDSLGYAKVNKNRQPGAKDERVNSITSELNRGSSPVPPEIIPMAVPMEEGESPQHTSSPLPSYRTVPETLRQAKEVLRLARVVKAEAEQMREEARKELNIAKKDRHEAMLLKKNAAEILRMAKERLNSVGAK